MISFEKADSKHQHIFPLMKPRRIYPKPFSLCPLGAGSAATSGLIPKGRLVMMLSRGRLADFPGGMIQGREAL